MVAFLSWLGEGLGQVCWRSGLFHLVVEGWALVGIDAELLLSQVAQASGFLSQSFSESWGLMADLDLLDGFDFVFNHLML